jgi:hypothetical protein
MRGLAARPSYLGRIAKVVDPVKGLFDLCGDVNLGSYCGSLTGTLSGGRFEETLAQFLDLM